ncbi:MAG: thiosulfate oxidation carrier complex protein SoxZ [Alphaproteobacteria bacterium]|nr:thiosulfate oxidation carrier complex protein SoxZ [Alphaproteobacteria bacterium]MBF0354406.1 thiosulfate oxidation carrier complex protein SoxZ [Alphaproteobacteria bacterium]
MAEVKIRLPKTIAKGELVSVRALVTHPMEVVERGKDGKIVEKVYNFIHTVTVTYNGKTIMTGEMTQSLSANPFIEFPLKVNEPGKLTITFEDTTGEKHTGSVDVAF